jgi:hypothetical protein
MAVSWGSEPAVRRRSLRRPQGRRVAEIELPVIQIRHARQALAERIEANDIGIHLADAHRQRIDLFCKYMPNVLDLGLFRSSSADQFPELIDRIELRLPRLPSHTDGKCPAHDADTRSPPAPRRPGDGAGPIVSLGRSCGRRK